MSEVRRSAGMTATGTIVAAVLAACIGGGVIGDDNVSADAAREDTVRVCETKRFYTAGDNGCRVSLALGQSAQLLVRDLQAQDPQVEGDAVELIGIANVSGSGSREWEIRAKAPGTSRIRITGSQPFSLTIVVPSH
ncbi:hypothetical protein BH23PSE2_BH23PSE2_05150 [soil metagenome]